MRIVPREFAGVKIGLYLRRLSERTGFFMVNVAQLVRASDCGSGGRGFKSHLSPIFFDTNLTLPPSLLRDDEVSPPPSKPVEAPLRQAYFLSPLPPEIFSEINSLQLLILNWEKRLTPYL